MQIGEEKSVRSKGMTDVLENAEEVVAYTQRHGVPPIKVFDLRVNFDCTHPYFNHGNHLVKETDDNALWENLDYES